MWSFVGDGGDVDSVSTRLSSVFSAVFRDRYVERASADSWSSGRPSTSGSSPRSSLRSCRWDPAHLFSNTRPDHQSMMSTAFPFTRRP